MAQAMMILRMVWAYRQALLSGAAVGVIGLWLHNADVARIERNQVAALAAQEVVLERRCAEEKAITKGVSDEFQEKYSDVSRKLSAARRMYANTCVKLQPPRSASGYNAEAGNALNAGQDAVAAESFVEFAGEAEKYRLQLIGCQDFITRTWAREK